MKRVLFAVVLASLFVASAGADLYSPNRPLSVLETNYFSLIFPAEARGAAEYLATFADSTYEEVAALLGTARRGRIPVILTPDSELINGYFVQNPYPRIVLYLAPTELDAEFGGYDDDLRKLFFHELTHAVSLTLLDPFQNFLAAVFGSPLGYSYYLTPLDLMEGVTVSFESRDGFGRAADPLAGAVIRQDIVEGRFKTFQQATGAWDDYPASQLYYFYGGYFSRMLQEKYGMEKYAELWRHIATGMLWRPLGDLGAIKGHFRLVYGISLEEAWSDFRDYMAIRAPIRMDPLRLRPAAMAGTLCASGKYLYYSDQNAAKIFRYDTTTKEESPVLDSLYTLHLAASADGSRLLISSIRFEGDLPRLLLREVETATGKVRDLPWKAFREAAYAGPASIVAIRVEGCETDLVIADGEGIRVLLPGSEKLSYSSPVVSSDGRTVYALERLEGRVSVVRVGLAEGRQVAVSVERLALPEGLGWLRYLSLDEGKLLMAWDDDKLYRLVELEGDTLRWQTVPLSGGIHEPVAANGKVFHFGYFADGYALCAFPEDRAGLSFAEGKAEWLGVEGDPPGAVSAYDRPPASATKKYHEAYWMLPRFWYPTIDGNMADGLTSVGLSLRMADPVERLAALASLSWNLPLGAPSWSARLDIQAWAPTISLEASDIFSSKSDASGTFTHTRSSEAIVGISDALRAQGGGVFSYGLGAGAAAWTELAAGSGLAAGYGPWDDAQAIASAKIGWRDYRTKNNDPGWASGWALRLASRGAYSIFPTELSPFSCGLEAGLDLKASPFGLSLAGAWAPLSGSGYGPSGYGIGEGVARSVSYPVFREFNPLHSGDYGPWYAQGQVSLRLLHVPIQRGIPYLYANRLYLEAGARGALASSATWDPMAGSMDFRSSLYGRLVLGWTPAIGMYAAILHPFSWIEAWLVPETGEYGFSFSLIELSY